MARHPPHGEEGSSPRVCEHVCACVRSMPPHPPVLSAALGTGGAPVTPPVCCREAQRLDRASQGRGRRPVWAAEAPLARLRRPLLPQASVGPSSCAGLSSRRRLTGSVETGAAVRGGCPPRWGVQTRTRLGWAWRRLEVRSCPFQRLHDLVLPLVMGVQQGEVLGSSPYTSSRCRRELYRLLLALLLAPSPRCPPPLACALQAFSLGQREDSLEVTAHLSPPLRCRECPVPDATGPPSLGP